MATGAAWLSQRNTNLNTFNVTSITLNSTMVSLGASTNSVYTKLSQGNFNSSVSTSSWVSSLTGRLSTTTVAMSANAQYQLALSQSSISTSVLYTSTLGTSWSTLSGATGLPNYSTISYTAGAVSGTGQYGVLGTSAGQLLVTSTFGQTFSGNANITSPTPFIYLPLDTVPANGSVTLGASPVSLTVVGTPTQAPSYVMGTGAVRLTNTIGAAPVQYIRGPISLMSNFTVSLWFNLQTPADGVNYQIIFSMFTKMVQIYINATATELYALVPSGASPNIISFGPLNITINRWYSVTLIYQSGGLCSFYVNNALVGSGISVTPTGLSSTNFGVGYYDYNPGYNYPFNGYIDDVNIYNTAIPFTPMYPSQSFTSTAVSNTGQYMLATMANQGLYMSSNFGSTWIQVTGVLLSAIWSNAQVSATGQYMLVNAAPQIVQPQLIGLTGNNTSTTPVTTSWQTNGITWTSNSSSVYASTFQPWNLFSMNYTSTISSYAWANNSLTYTTTGNSSTITTFILGSVNASIGGDWAQIQSSVPVIMYSYQLATGGGASQIPKTFYIVGSNDGINWYPIQNASIAAQPTASQKTLITSTIIVNSSASQTMGSSTLTATTYSTTTTPFTYFRIIGISTFMSTNGYLEIGQWIINFQAGGQTYSTNYGTTWLSGLPLYTIIQPQLPGISTTTWQTNGNTWTASASTSQGGTTASYLAFNNTLGGNNTWASAGTYTAGTGVYTGSAFTPNIVGTGTYTGEWLQIQSSTPIVMNSYSFANGGNSGGNQAPRIYQIVGSNDNSTWYSLQTVTVTGNPYALANTYANTIIVNSPGTFAGSNGSSYAVTTTTFTTGAYSYFRLCVNATIGGAYGAAELGEWVINFVGGTLSTQALSESGQYQLTANATVSPALLTQLGFENSYVDSAGGLATGVLSGTTRNVTFTSTSKVGSTSLAVSNIPAAQSGLGYVNYTIPTGHPLRSPTLLTIAFWMYPTSISVWPNQSSPLGFNNGTNGPGPYFYLSSVMSFAYYTSTGITNAIAGTTAIAQSRWIHVAITYSNGNLLLYVNGAVEASVVITGSLSLNVTSSYGPITNMFIGCEHTGYGGYNGYIDDVRIYNAGLTSTQIYTLYATTVLTPAIYITQNFNMNTLVLPTFTPALNASTNVPVASAVSNTGQYMVFITNNTTGSNVYYSTNYGATFTGLQLGTSVLTSCAMSYDGSYMTIASGATVYTLNNNSTGFSVALGNQAGYQNQANNAIAIGNYAGYQNQTANSIILNASGPGALGTGLNAVAQGFYVAPIASCVASSSQSFSILGYGTDNQVVQTGLTVLPDTGTFNLNAPVGSTTSGILSSRYYLWGVGDNQDANGIDNNVYGPWYGVGLSGIPGFTNVPCLCGYSGVSMRSGGGYLVLTEAGNVGIGKTNPKTALDIKGVLTVNEGIPAAAAGYFQGIEIMYIGSGATGYGNISATNPGLTYTSLCLNPYAGRVGIGKTNPSQLLDVNGAINCTSFLVNGTAVATGTGSVWGVNGSFAYYTSGNVGIGTISPTNLLTVGPAVLPSANSAGTTQLVVYGNINCFRNRLIFSNAATDWNHSIYNNANNVDNEGAWDGMKFNVYQGAWFRVGNASGVTPITSVFMDTLGSVGIGTTSPVSRLHLYSTGATGMSIGTNTSTNLLQLGIANGPQNYSTFAATGDSIIRASAGNLMLQSSSGGAAIYINTSNNVGIATSNPTMSLSVGQYGGMLGGSTFTATAPASGVSTGLTIPAGTMYLISCATVAGSGVSNAQWYNTSLVQYGSGNTAGFVTLLSSSNIVILCSSAGVITVNIPAGGGSYTFTINAIRLC